MAEGKKSFIAYSDWQGTFNAIPDEIAGQLIKYIFSYVNDENPEPHENYVVNALFEQIKSTLKRDLDKWDKQRKQRSEAGKRSAEARKSKINDRSTTVNEQERKATVNVNVNDNVNVSTDVDVYTEEIFLQRWKDARQYYDKQPTNIKKLTVYESNSFKQLLKDYKKEHFEKAMVGLFRQNTYPITRLRPTHFLQRDNFETYLTCFKTKEELFKKDTYKKPIERI